MAEHGLAAYVRQIFEDGFFHADPQTGNLLVTAEGDLILLDFGIMGVLRPEKRRAFVGLLAGSVDRDVDAIMHSLHAIGIAVPPEQADRLKDELYLLVTEYRDLSFRQFDSGGLLGDGADLLPKNRIRLPSSLMRMVVVLVMEIDLGRTLDPPASGSPSGLSRTCAMRFGASCSQSTRRSMQSGGFATRRWIRSPCPGAIRDAARRFSQGPVEIDLINDDFRRIETMLDQVGDKVLIGMVVSAIVVGSSLVLDSAPVPLPFITVIAGIRYLGAAVIGFVTVYHVLRNRP